jgi:hypothetical protein
MLPLTVRFLKITFTEMDMNALMKKLAVKPGHGN